MSGPNASLVALNLEVGAGTFRGWRPPLRVPRPPPSHSQAFVCPGCDVWISNMKQYAVHWGSKKHQRRYRVQIVRAEVAMQFLGVFFAEKWAAEDQYRKNQTLIREVLWWVNEYFRSQALRNSAKAITPSSTEPPQ